MDMVLIGFMIQLVFHDRTPSCKQYQRVQVCRITNWHYTSNV